MKTLKKGQLEEKREAHLIENVDRAMDFSHDVNNLEAMMPTLKSKMAKSLLSTINKDREKRSKKSQGSQGEIDEYSVAQDINTP